MNDLVGRKYTISGMTIEVLSDAGDDWEVRNVTTRDIIRMKKSMLENAIKLGKAEEVTSAYEPQ